MNGRQVQFIRTNLGGEFAKSSEFSSVLTDKHQCGVQTTVGYSSWWKRRKTRQTIQEHDKSKTF